MGVKIKIAGEAVKGKIASPFREVLIMEAVRYRAVRSLRAGSGDQDTSQEGGVERNRVGKMAGVFAKSVAKTAQTISATGTSL